MKIGKYLKFSIAALAAFSGLAGTAVANEPVTFQLSWKAQPEFAGFYQALEKGYYKSCGIDMTLREGAPGIDPTQLLTTGAVDVALLPQNDGVLRVNSVGFPAKAVMASMQKFLTVMLYHDESGIKKPEDMKGKPVLISQGNRTTFWPFLKTKYGYTDDQLRTYTGQMAMWMSDKTSIQQGVVTQEPFRIKTEIGKFPSYFLLSDMGYNPYTVIVVVSQKMIDEKPAVVQCLVDGSRKGWVEFMKDPSVAFTAINKLNPQITKELMAYSHDMMKTNNLVEDEDTAKHGIGWISDERWKSHYDMLVANGLFPANLDYKSAYTTKFLEKPMN
jgi:NitT/TauT family transport system substrate-binding protein